jgi:HJR/Mrr/RecB family endonuclease
MTVAGPKKGKKNPKRGVAGPWIWLLFFGLAYWGLPESRSYFLIAGALVLIIWFWTVIARNRRQREMSEIDRMDGHEFERFLVILFKRLGYKTSHIGGSGGDFGADLIIEKDGAKICVQAKNYGNAAVGNDAVQQVIAGAAYYDCEAALVVTNSTFTKAAKEQAAGSNVPVTLWDRNLLAEKLKK